MSTACLRTASRWCRITKHHHPERGSRITAHHHQHRNTHIPRHPVGSASLVGIPPPHRIPRRTADAGHGQRLPIRIRSVCLVTPSRSSRTQTRRSPSLLHRCLTYNTVPAAVIRRRDTGGSTIPYYPTRPTSVFFFYLPTRQPQHEKHWPPRYYLGWQADAPRRQPTMPLSWLVPDKLLPTQLLRLASIARQMRQRLLALSFGGFLIWH